MPRTYFAGIPSYQSDHTLRVAKFSIEAVKAANTVAVDETDPSKGFVNIRVRDFISDVNTRLISDDTCGFCYAIHVVGASESRQR